jgi:hypothetical protein
METAENFSLKARSIYLINMIEAVVSNVVSVFSCWGGGGWGRSILRML